MAANPTRWDQCPLDDALIPDLERLGLEYTGTDTHAPLVVDGTVVPEIYRCIVRNLGWPTAYTGGALFDGELRWLTPPERPYFFESDDVDEEGWLKLAEIDSPDGLDDGIIVDAEEQPDEDPEVAIIRWVGHEYEMKRIQLSELLARLEPVAH